MEARGGTDAAVLLALYGWPDDPGPIFTERRADLRRHAGEISFPGGRQDDGDADLPRPRCARPRRRSASTRGGRAERGPAADRRPSSPATASTPSSAWSPTRRELGLEPNPAEVETVLTFSLDVLRESYEMRRLVRRGVPIHTPTYEVDDHLIWGATARILGDLLERLG